MSDDVWSYALKLYARPGVEPACLALQEGGADICLLLAAAWLGSTGVAFAASRMSELESTARGWREEVVVPLRSLRQRWRESAKQDAELASLRERIKQLELEAEKVLLGRLETVAKDWPRGEAKDLARWLEAVSAEAGGLRRDARETLRTAASLS
ncbi:TIGR02444 family protein [Pseudomonas nicosulfuronedens]|uniref:TIGR02444 family protein n=1 Tax=Pseudomonas nicosulfuronedens TaxID=2571105 RepID=A0A5R9RET7_9PSED|nr:TIGR02444 family protein [Pseudomonas nicosulfuronedens]MDH1009122.1 TIGR02444 family protein [Pseudomonas nicosulfuronedens]MDH1978035.1 TIGR02444 family protein [Pseudomonas nicosulfuronedens]MDH2027086.1 TIGR02444 family protein [Pseudomonas nicosulfuronedens]TLX81028.1 TIGR02444 family protein [Pseudomonas nicosulfuronedens]